MKKKMQAGGVMPQIKTKAPMVDEGGAFTKVQERTLKGFKDGGKVTKAKDGKSLKPVDKASKPGLAKLPTAVRNKMGYQKTGGTTKKAGMHKMPNGSMMKNSMMKSGGKMPMKKMMGGGKCKNGC